MVHQSVCCLFYKYSKNQEVTQVTHFLSGDVTVEPRIQSLHKVYKTSDQPLTRWFSREISG